MSSPPSCRILTISSSTSQAKLLAERIVANAASNSAGESPAFEGANTGQSPWTISNKYYTAPVHFSFAQTTDVIGEDAAEVPACIFVFSLEETFKTDFNSLTTRLKNSDFEVSIAVSTPSIRADSSTSEEQDQLEAFFGEHGFEYVNGNVGREIQQVHDMDDLEGIPGIGRIVDALSTILWPSMVQKTNSKRAKTRSIMSVPAPPGEEDGLRSLLNIDNDASGSTTTLHHEMAALEKWLEEGADDEKDPWLNSRHYQPPQPGSAEPTPEISNPAQSGFDDNFSDFVSAPAPIDNDLDTDRPLQSQTEVELMSQQILEMGMSEDADEGESQAPFDLSRVLAALEAMKEEIAGITDEDEKRKAAAKVTLGLVYGLDQG